MATSRVNEPRLESWVLDLKEPAALLVKNRLERGGDWDQSWFTSLRALDLSMPDRSLHSQCAISLIAPHQSQQYWRYRKEGKRGRRCMKAISAQSRLSVPQAPVLETPTCPSHHHPPSRALALLLPCCSLQDCNPPPTAGCYVCPYLSGRSPPPSLRTLPS